VRLDHAEKHQRLYSSTEQPRRVANFDRREVSVESGYQRVWYLRTPALRGLFQNLGRLDPIFSGTKLISLTNNRGSRFADITGIQILGVLKSEGEVGVAKFLDASRWPSGSDPLYKVFQNEPNAQRPARQLRPPSNTLERPIPLPSKIDNITSSIL